MNTAVSVTDTATISVPADRVAIAAALAVVLYFRFITTKGGFLFEGNTRSGRPPFDEKASLRTITSLLRRTTQLAVGRAPFGNSAGRDLPGRESGAAMVRASGKYADDFTKLS